MIIKLLEIFLITSSVCNAENLNFFQNEYDVQMEIARIVWYNISYFKYLKADFVLFNRTTRVFNATMDLIVDLKNDVLGHVQVYKFTSSNEYRFFPITVQVNTCAEYTKNTFGAKDIFLQYSDHNPCDLKKGVYHIYNVIPDFSRFPPHLPRGSYKVVGKLTYHSHHLYTIEFCGKIKDKPIDWEKIPKRN